ncbi:MAG: multifunctional oxoglutarate decarboxylase/oxoglutarate dehydrogenase thiamine pyrophosphate-binding subunit/dihydrolipoyllysine-residue succinyltransferase subunit [Acidobacteria bacterium]|nr:multifunctional oxoglutarate decarboxylase/oxoglutarate dehydrogenase thiamine pyrophosphate-binding subunit/dihydrolipoyllysine-residue succinyltransferase subunit [Acidobacteriota bacterium]
MAAKPPSINNWFEEEIYQAYQHDRRAVDDAWRQVFDEQPPAGNGRQHDGNGHPTPALETSVRTMAAPPSVPPPPVPPPQLDATDSLVPLRGAAARIAENMNLSLTVPTATSQRSIPVKVLEENRRILNEHRGLQNKSKISFTHLIGWAVAKAIETNPNLNNAYAEQSGEPFRLVRGQINLGIAVDVAGKDGARSLMVPNIRNAGAMSFDQYLVAFDDLVARARGGKLAPADFQGTTISLTNPGTVGTLGSVPRLMPGQGAIIATGAMDYPAEFLGMPEETRTMLGVGKVMMITCTYDHRVIQGAESGTFLARVQALLQGEDSFYDRIFASLRVPHRPVVWTAPGKSAQPEAQRAADVSKDAAIVQMINAYRVRGHLIADLDPLGAEQGYHPELDPANYGISLWDLDRSFNVGNFGYSTGSSFAMERATAREILDMLRTAYCGKVGCEYMHIQHPEQKRWLQERLELKQNQQRPSEGERRRILARLLDAEMFEQFLDTRFKGHKRFSLEGGETALAILDELADRGANGGVQEIVIGMAHRGRLGVLANLTGKPLSQLFSEFEGNLDPESAHGSGDVKYHLGASGQRVSFEGNTVTVTVAPNPSHLEAVDPVVEGIVRPKQDHLGDTERSRVIPLLVHGDAAFAGQGVVAETLNLSQLDGYTTGGTIHLIINNQIGFTTNPDDARSTPYSTDVARMVQAPIFHVNGDDPEAAFRVAQIAFDFRQRFKKDVVIDMICYRKHGHNEGDDPSFTQPILYRRIAQHPSVATQYSDKLAREGTVSKDNLTALRAAVKTRLEEGFNTAKTLPERFETVEMTVLEEAQLQKIVANTAVSPALLERAARGMTTFPADFTLHPKLKPLIDRRADVVNGAPMDWATAEALAFGTLVLEGTAVRLSGQDCGRGTFSQRHLELYDYATGQLHTPMSHLAPEQARFEVVNSSLSEYAVMGFEFGYSVGDPLTLVMWEGQFGDFANGAQILIDQFLTCCESKWGQPSGLVLLLPHGYEGQGPEHSSGRIERFLQLCADNNIQVCNCTTPAQYFHLLRRQMHGGEDRRGVRKPLIIFTPKSLLRHAKAVSTASDLTSGGFRELIQDAGPAEGITRLLLCSGKVYYDLLAAREERGAHHIAIARLEQIYPFPAADIGDMLARYPAACEVMWVQEEPRNMGAWRFVQEKLDPVLRPSGRAVRPATRRESASPAAGSVRLHQEEFRQLMEMAFTAGEVVRKRRVRVPKRKK